MAHEKNVLARVRDFFLDQIAPSPHDAEIQPFRGLSMDYIREAERLERERVAASEEIFAALD